MSSDTGRAFWDRSAARYDRSMWLLGGPLEPMVDRVADEVKGAGRVLEVGAGTGLVTRRIAPVVGTLIATDYSAAMVEQLRARVREEGLSRVSVRRLDLHSLDGRERYDAVVAANLLHLVPDLPRALAALSSSLVPGGRLIVPTFCHDETPLARAVSGIMGAFGFPGQRRFTTQRLAASLVQAGLTVHAQHTLPGLLPIGFVSARTLT